MANGNFLQSHWSDAQKSFFRDFREQTVIAYSMQDRIWQRRVRMALQFKPDDEMHLYEIKAKPHGKGHGGRGIKWLSELTEQHGLLFSLKAAPFNRSQKNPLSDFDNLLQWYRKRGFVQDNRYPKDPARMILGR